jgi:hypothetical protein
MVGIGLDDGLDAQALAVLLCVLLELHLDGGATWRICGCFDHLETAAAVGGPLPCLVVASLAADDNDAVGDHEGGIEADAELTDQVDVGFFLLGFVLFCLGELFCKAGRARTGDGAKIIDQLVM